LWHEADVCHGDLIAERILPTGRLELLLKRCKAVVDRPLPPLHLVLETVLGKNPKVLHRLNACGDDVNELTNACAIDGV
jgi:hypothetical protein